MKANGLIYGIITYMIWGFLPLFWQRLNSNDPGVILSNRIIWSLVFMSLILGVAKPNLLLSNIRKLFANPQQILWMILAAILIGSNWLTFVMSVVSNKTSDASFAYFLSPLFTVVIGKIFFQEKMNLLKYFGLGFLVIACIIKLIQNGAVPWIALIMSLSVAIYGGIEKKSDFNPLFRMFIESLVLTPLAIAYLYFSGHSFMKASAEINFLFIMSGVLTAVPLLLFMVASDRLTQGKLAVVQYLNPFIMLLLAVNVFHEPFFKTDIYVFMLIGIGISCFCLGNTANNHTKELIKHGEKSRTKSSISSHQ